MTGYIYVGLALLLVAVAVVGTVWSFGSFLLWFVGR